MNHLTAIFLMWLLPLGPLNLDKDASELKVSGTSSLHDWEIKVEDFSMEATRGESALSDVTFKAVVKSMKSGKGIMDSKTYDALIEEEHPEIIFKATSLTLDNHALTGKGKLTIAGVTKTLDVSLSYTQNGEAFTIKGDIPLKMTDFEIDPPTAMFGSLVTGDDIKIHLNLILK